MSIDGLIPNPFPKLTRRFFMTPINKPNDLRKAVSLAINTQQARLKLKQPESEFQTPHWNEVDTIYTGVSAALIKQMSELKALFDSDYVTDEMKQDNELNTKTGSFRLFVEELTKELEEIQVKIKDKEGYYKPEDFTLGLDVITKLMAIGARIGTEGFELFRVVTERVAVLVESVKIEEVENV